MERRCSLTQQTTGVSLGLLMQWPRGRARIKRDVCDGPSISLPQGESLQFQAGKPSCADACIMHCASVPGVRPAHRGSQPEPAVGHRALRDAFGIAPASVAKFPVQVNVGGPGPRFPRCRRLSLESSGPHGQGQVQPNRTTASQRLGALRRLSASCCLLETVLSC